MNRLQHFVAEILEHEGALVEPIEPEGLEVLAPPPVQQATGLADLARLGFGAELPPGAQRVGLEADWLDRLARLLGERGRRLHRVAAVDNPPPGSPERVLEHGLELLNAVWRLKGVRPAWTRYLILTFRYTARSDENRDGIVRLGLNLATGAALDGMLGRLEARLDEVEAPPDGAAAVPAGVALPADWERGRLDTALGRAIPDRVRRHLEPFLRGMRRRQERDLARLHGYYGGLRQEALARLAGLAESGPEDRQAAEKRQRESLRLEAIAREYAAKTADLRQKYAMSVVVEWVQTLDLVMPVQRLEVLIRRRKGERVVALDWNPLVRQLEPPPCEYSYTAERPRLVCDDALHLVSPAAHGACPGCGREYCRACHPRACPKCGHVETAAGPAGGLS